MKAKTILIWIAIVHFGRLEGCSNYKVLDVKITQADKTEILKLHNEYRQMVAKGKIPGQPPAKEMPLMVWDESLAAAAQKLADTCDFHHDTTYKSKKYASYGQNLAIQMTTQKTDMSPWNKQAVQGWFDEYKDYKFGPLGNDGNDFHKIGHYTQLLWAKTTAVGCGVKFFIKDNWLNKYYVCNYGPVGNVIGEFPYQVKTKN